MKSVFAVWSLGIVICTASQAGAYNKNQSAEFLRIMHRNASTDPDAAFYNPAGLAFLGENGFYMSISNQGAFQDKDVQDDSALIKIYRPGDKNQYHGDINVFLYPNLNLAYKLDDWGFFFNFAPIGGGGGGSYKDGIPQYDVLILATANAIMRGVENASGGAFEPNSLMLTSYDRNLDFKGSVYKLASTVGIARKLTDMISVAGGLRVVYGKRNYEGDVKDIQIATSNPAADGIVSSQLGDVVVDLESNGTGYGAIVGLHLRPMAGLDIGLRGEYFTRLQVKNETVVETKSDALRAAIDKTSFRNGQKVRLTEPPVVGLGVSYRVLPELRLEADCTVLFESRVDLIGDEEDARRDAVWTGIGLEYQVLPILKASIGYGYDSASFKPRARNEIDFGLASHSGSIGASVEIIPGVEVTAGVAFVKYISHTGKTSQAPATLTSLEPKGNQKVEQQTILGGLGVTLRTPDL